MRLPITCLALALLLLVQTDHPEGAAVVQDTTVEEQPEYSEDPLRPSEKETNPSEGDPLHPHEGEDSPSLREPKTVRPSSMDREAEKHRITRKEIILRSVITVGVVSAVLVIRHILRNR